MDLKQRKQVAIIGVRGFPSHYGGFETAVRKLVPKLIEDGFKVRVYSREERTPQPVTNSSGNSDIKVVRTLGINSKRLSTVTFGFTAIMHAAIFRPDVILIMNVGNCIWLPILRLLRIPTVVNVDGLEWTRKKWGFLARKMFLLGAWNTAKFADKLVFDSLEIAKYWERIFKRTGTFIPYGGDINKQELDRIKKPFLLVVSRLVPENSIDVFIESCPNIQKIIPVVIVGGGSSNKYYEAQLQKLMSLYPDVSWLGQISDEGYLNHLWETCTMYFHGHTVGGTNPALIQAMASGAPVIAIDTPFNREVLQDAGVFVRPNSDELVSAISSLKKNAVLRRKMASAATRIVEQKYTWENVCEAYSILLFKTILSK